MPQKADSIESAFFFAIRLLLKMANGTDIVEHGFWYYNWGNAASVLGLVISFLTYFVARRASAAASRAAKYVLVRSLSQDLQQAHSIANEMYEQLAHKAWAPAGMRCKDLGDALRSLSSRWADHLASSSRDNLAKAQEKNAALERVLLHVEPENLEPDFGKVIRVSREISKVLIDERAAKERELDRDGR